MSHEWLQLVFNTALILHGYVIYRRLRKLEKR
jgi:hypothetical protein